MWTDLTLLNNDSKWDYRLPKNVYNNLIELKTLLTAKGYSPGTLTTTAFSGFGMPRNQHKTALNVVENNITVLYTALDFLFPWYVSAVSYNLYYPQTAQLNRWVDFCNHLKSILDSSINWDTSTPLEWDSGSPIFYLDS